MRSYILLSLLALLSLTQILAGSPKSFKLDTARNLQGYYSQAGTFSLVEAEAGIVTQNPGVFVNVYFDNSTSGGSGDLQFDQYRGVLMLSLYSSDTTFTAGCLGFTDYNCTKAKCELTGDNDTIVYPNFTANGAPINTSVYIDLNYWSLAIDPFLSNECNTTNIHNNRYGTGLTGVLGLGYKSDAKKNFVMTQTHESIMGGTETETRAGEPKFSIFLNADGKSGDLLFDFDSTRALTSTPLYTFYADENWYVDGVSSVQVADQTLELPTKMIFDINSDALGLPLEIYNQVVAAINANVEGLSCPTNEYYRPRCQYTGKLDVLPDIKINVAGQSINIPGTVYAAVEEKIDIKPDSIFLHLRGLTPNTRNNSNFINEEFADLVILDQHVMGYYYSLFDTGSEQIQLYMANHGKSDKALITIIICLVIGLIVGFSIYRYKKIKKARMAANPPLLQTRMGDQEMNLLPGQRR